MKYEFNTVASLKSAILDAYQNHSDIYVLPSTFVEFDAQIDAYVEMLRDSARTSPQDVIGAAAVPAARTRLAWFKELQAA